MNGDFRKHSTAFKWLFLPFCRIIAWILLTILGPCRYLHRRKVPKRSGLVILANHLSDIDPVVVQWACPRPIFFMAKSELFEMPVLGKIIRWFRAFPVKRGAPDRGAIKFAAEVVANDEIVCIFPEGKISSDGQLQDLLPGAALIVRHSRAPIICCRLKNTQAIMPYTKVIPKPALKWVTATWSDILPYDPERSSDEIMAWVKHNLSAEEVTSATRKS